MTYWCPATRILLTVLLFALGPAWTEANDRVAEFAAGKIVRIRHEYLAIPGFGYFPGEPREVLSQTDGPCADNNLIRALEAVPKSDRGPGLNMEWVKYILTTANTFKSPKSY